MDDRWFRLGDRGRYPGEVPINYGIAIIGMSSLTGDLLPQSQFVYWWLCLLWLEY